MENNYRPFDYSATDSLQWLRSKEDFVEFIVILAHFIICSNELEKKSGDEPEFDRLCDSLGNSLVKVFKMDILP